MLQLQTIEKFDSCVHLLIVHRKATLIICEEGIGSGLSKEARPQFKLGPKKTTQNSERSDRRAQTEIDPLPTVERVSAMTIKKSNRFKILLSRIVLFLSPVTLSVMQYLSRVQLGNTFYDSTKIMKILYCKIHLDIMFYQVIRFIRFRSRF